MAATHNISSCQCHQRADCWWKSSIRHYPQHTLHSELSLTEDGLVVEIHYKTCKLHSELLVTSEGGLGVEILYDTGMLLLSSHIGVVIEFYI